MKTAPESSATNSWEWAPALLASDGLPDDCVRRLEKSLRKQWKRYGRKLRHCQKELSEEAIHDFRVEARRLLSTVELLNGLVPPKPARKIRGALKEHLGIFADLRDVQVQLPAVDQMRGAFPAAAPFGDYLRRRVKRFAGSARKAIRKARTRSVGELIESSASAVRARRKEYAGEPGRSLVLGSTGSAFARVMGLQARIDPADPETIHRTRVAFKRFRYMAETVLGYLPRRNEALVEAMHRYQTVMGDMQDAHVLCRGFERFLAKHDLDLDPARQLAEELSVRRQRLIDACMRETDQLLEFWPRGASPTPRNPGSRMFPRVSEF